MPLQQGRERARTRLRAEISEGIARLWRQRFMRSIALLIGATNFVSNALPLLVIGWLWVWAVQAAVLIVMPNALALGAVLGVGSLFGVSFNVVVATYRYALVPDRLQARTVSVVRLIVWGTIPLAQIVAGLLAQGIGAGPSFLAFAGVMLAATAAPSVRHAPPIDALVAEPA